jgi:hypothetical protein
MRNDLASLTAAPRPLTIGGKTYQVRPLTIDDYGRLQAWLDAQWPDPFDAVNAEIARREYSPAQQKHLLTSALELATRPKPKIGSDEAEPVVSSAKGVAQILYLAIRRDDPSFTVADAEAILPAMTPADFAKIFRASEAEHVLGDPDPKATGTTTDPSPAS